jgi:hypothetical protein
LRPVPFAKSDQGHFIITAEEIPVSTTLNLKDLHPELHQALRTFYQFQVI